MVEMISLDQLQRCDHPVLDVRSPGEFAQGHIPGAISFPLFSDEERAQLGICYKNQGREATIALGYRLVEPKIPTFVDALQTKWGHRRPLAVHCWRGGLRSRLFAQFLEEKGHEALVLEGGYKTYRRWALRYFEEGQFPPLFVIGGYTGVGKTELLHDLPRESVLDLEGLAHHTGSAFGYLLTDKQPSQEQWENSLALLLSKAEGPLFVEDESCWIGRCRIPNRLYEAMKQAPLVFLTTDRTQRIERLLAEYEETTADQLIHAVGKIAKHLGSERANQIIAHLRAGERRKAIAPLLDYYDKKYDEALPRRSGPTFRHSLSSLFS